MSDESDSSVEDKQQSTGHKPVIAADSQQVDENSEPTNPARANNAALIIISFLLIICIGATGYLGYQGLRLKEFIHNQLSNTAQAVEKSQQQIKEDFNVKKASEGERINQLDQQQKQLLQNIQQAEKEQAAIVELVKKLSEEKPDSNLDWGLMEAEYLVVIAMHRLLLEGDIATAIVAIETADKRLEGLSDPGLIPVRRQFTKDLNALKSVNQTDITGPALYLADLVLRVESLPLKKQHVQTRSVKNGVDDASLSYENWQQIPQLIWQELKSLIVIKKNSDGESAFILPEEEYFIYQNLKLELNNARMSVLLRDDQNLKASIELIEKWLIAHFMIDDAAVSNLLESMQRMNSLQLKTELPDITSSLETLKAFSRSPVKGQVQ